MTEQPIIRRLAAILAADAAGYSAMIGVDEAGTVAALRRIWSETLQSCRRHASWPHSQDVRGWRAGGVQQEAPMAADEEARRALLAAIRSGTRFALNRWLMSDRHEKIGAEGQTMGSGVSTYLRILVTEEMRRRVSSAARGGEALSVLSSAAEIAQAFPGSDLSVDEVANQLCAEATRAGVAVELGRGRAPAH